MTEHNWIFQSHYNGIYASNYNNHYDMPALKLMKGQRSSRASDLIRPQIMCLLTRYV